MLRERAYLGIEVGIEPVGLGDGGAEVVQDEALRHAAKVPPGVYQTA
jgi:hypothetical protein